ncbi:MAG: D-aminoacyl-tRNA deacylase [Bifidobacteriaceae bacterium]|jgi:D-tyrosyl-tRNA(Tyr) deacylase|nr:D-aminoacyl-tRNA deacylase [Bifidobacteriaceae bacterium]
MRVVLQKVASASVRVDAAESGLDTEYVRSIGIGFVVLVGVSDADGDAEVEWVAHKIAHLRVFADENDKMNLGISDVGGSVLSISQFTLFADIHKGNRPSFVGAGEPGHAKRVWERLNGVLTEKHGLPVESGIFGTHMKVELVNDGPVTIVIDTDEDMKH